MADQTTRRTPGALGPGATRPTKRIEMLRAQQSRLHLGQATCLFRNEVAELLDEVDALRDVIANLEGEVDHHSSAAEALRQQVAALTAERDRLAEQAAEGEARLHAALVDLEGVNLNALTVDELHQMLTTAMRGPAGGA